MKLTPNPRLQQLTNLVRYYILASTTAAGSGHTTTALSATDLMTSLLFGGLFKYNSNHKQHPNNDRLIFSKGHASPLLYALWAAAGQISEQDLMGLRQFNSSHEGHPTMRFPYTEVATGSLGQGLSLGVGMAINAKYLDKLPYKTYVLLGDSEMAEGSNWEAIMLAAHYKLDNLIGIIDVNRLGQSRETMFGHDLQAYQQRLAAFDWHTIVIDGHDLEDITAAYKKAQEVKNLPTMIIAKTLKGKGIPQWEDKNGYHAKALNQTDLDELLNSIGKIDKTPGIIPAPEDLTPAKSALHIVPAHDYSQDNLMAPKQAYGYAIARLAGQNSQVIVLDAEVSNSTNSQMVKDDNPDRFFEMFIAEQNLVGVGTGLAMRGKIPFMSSFCAFYSRAFDQIRMAQYSQANLKIIGAYCGVSIGVDGPSGMGLEDIAMIRSIRDSVVLYPSDGVSTDKLVDLLTDHYGIDYLRVTREPLPILYDPDSSFEIGGSHVLESSPQDQVTVIGAGITVHQALKAYDQLKKDNITVRVIDLYSVKPLDQATLEQAANQTSAILVVEDHYPGGGIGEAVAMALATSSTPIYSLAVTKMPRSGQPMELLAHQGIDSQGISNKVKQIITNQLH